MHYLFARLCCMAFLAPFILISCDHSKQNQNQALPHVPAVKLSKTPIPLTKDYIGITQSMAAVAIKARVKGFLKEIHFVEGKAVKKGQLLFVIDPRPFIAKVESASGALAQAIAAQDFQSLQYKRMKILVKKGDVSEAVYDKTRADYEAAKGQVESAKANLEMAKIDLSYCYMYAPNDGIIGKKYVDVGNLVGGTEETLLANVVSLDPIYVEFSPSTHDFAEMLSYRKNMPFSAQATLPLESKIAFQGKMDLINNEADVPTSTVFMRATIQNPQQLLLPGIYVNLRLVLSDKEEVLLVPSKAVMQTQGQRTVYRVDKNGEVSLVSIHSQGQYQQYDIVESGLDVSDVILVDGLQKIRPGMKVVPLLSQKLGS